MDEFFLLIILERDLSILIGLMDACWSRTS